MGEAHDRMKMGLAPRIMKPGEQIQVDLANATQKECSCGCKYFIPVFSLYTVSAIVSPIGKELTAQQPVLVCMKCQTPVELKVVEG